MKIDRGFVVIAYLETDTGEHSIRPRSLPNGLGTHW